jgi:hypothetical protein
MEQPAGRRRRIDRVSDPALLDDVADAPAADLRALRDECREEEARLSYARRVLQGQLDIARSEQRRRSGAGGEEGGASLVADLPRILADEPSTSTRQPRTVTFYAPQGGGRRTDDSILELPSLGRLPDLSDEELADLIRTLEAEESQVSDARRRVLDNLDGLQEELVHRYRDGGTTIEEIMAPTPTPSPEDRSG